MQKIIYGTITESVEDYDTAVVVLVPEDMDYEQLERELDENFDQFETQTIVTWEDVRDALALILAASDVEPAEQANIILDLFDAIDNGDG